jgi:hypothetical protein
MILHLCQKIRLERALSLSSFASTDSWIGHLSFQSPGFQWLPQYNKFSDISSGAPKGWNISAQGEAPRMKQKRKKSGAVQ